MPARLNPQEMARIVRSPDRYNFSFVVATLRPELARIVAEIYLIERDWEATKARVLATNALQCRSKRSLLLIERELRFRLATLTDAQLDILALGTGPDRTALCWLATLKHEPFLRLFAVEVLRDKLANHDPVLRYSDYAAFVEAQAVTHPELAGMTELSRKKVKQILVHMLTEAGLIVGRGKHARVQRPLLSAAVRDAITTENPTWLAGFLYPDNELGAA